MKRSAGAEGTGGGREEEAGRRGLEDQRGKNTMIAADE